MPPIYDVKGPIKANGQRMREGRVELPESVGARLVVDGYLTLATDDDLAPATHTQPSDQGRENGLSVGGGGGATAPSPEPQLNSDTQSSGPTESGPSDTLPPIGGVVSADAGHTINDERKDETPEQPAVPGAGAEASAAPASKSKVIAKATKKKARKSAAGSK